MRRKYKTQGPRPSLGDYLAIEDYHAAMQKWASPIDARQKKQAAIVSRCNQLSTLTHRLVDRAVSIIRMAWLRGAGV